MDFDAKLTVDSLILRAQRLHSPPEIACSLLRLMRDDEFDIREVVDCIERDPALTAKILRIVNSSRYSLRHRVSSVQHAFAYLGCRTIRVLALTFSIVDTFTRGLGKQFYAAFWTRALITASVAARLAGTRDAVDARDAYTSGLLADIGVLLLAQVKGEDYKTLYQEASTGDSLVEAETRSYGFDHTAVSSRLLTDWEFPESLITAIASHHDAQRDEPMAASVRGGELVADLLTAPHADRVLKARQWLAQHFQLEIDGFVDLVVACKEEVLLEAEVYGVHLERSINGQALLDEAQRQLFDTALHATQDLCSLEAMIDGRR